MAHQRKLIRDQVVTMLTGQTFAGTRVKPTRVEPHKKTQLPAIAVYTLTDTIVRDWSDSTAPRELQHDLKLEIAGFVAHADSYPVDDAMDDLAQQIEDVMDADVYLGSTAGDSILTDTVMQVLEDSGLSDPMVGIVTLTYSVTYRTAVDKSNATADLLTADAKYALVGGVASTQIPEDSINVRSTP